jgi:REP element-mobilizing transposase RayT
MKMPFDPKHHHRRSIQLKRYDYSGPGSYFLTVCAQGKHCLFGEIRNGVMGLNEAGCMLTRWWIELPNKFPTVRADTLIAMPNHLHGILTILGVGLDGRTFASSAPTAASLPTVVQWFKTMTSNDYIRGVKERGWAPFHGRLWQRNYYEHVIRDGRSLEKIREYIDTNPLRWHLHKENLQCHGTDGFDTWLDAHKTAPFPGCTTSGAHIGAPLRDGCPP